MQSLHAARALLNALAFLLALVASAHRDWTIVEPASLAAAPPADDAYRLAFSPSEFCLDFHNGSSDCHAYAYLLTHSDFYAAAGIPPRANSSAASLASMSPDPASNLVPATPSHRLHSAVTSWCIASTSSFSSSSSSSSSGAGGSWLLQGAQSMLCLIVLETCVYTKLIWLLIGFCSVGFSSATFLRWDSFESSSSFTTFAQASLGVLLLIEWWGYALYFLDAGYLAMLQLVVHFGASFRYTALSTLVSLLACRVSSHISGPISSLELVKLHAMPPSPRSQSSGRRRHRYHHLGFSIGSPDSPSPDAMGGEEDAALDCLEEAADPLKCPANYSV